MQKTMFRICKIMAVAIVAVTIPLMAQENATTSATASAGSAQAAAQSSTNATVQMRPVAGELQGKLDSKNAKVGDSVALKTTAAVKTADGTVIPKGTRLVGHVTYVQTHESGDTEGRLGLLFDHAELKGGQSQAILSMIASVEPPVSIADAGSPGGDDGVSAAGNSTVHGSATARPSGGIAGAPSSAANADPGSTTGVEDRPGGANRAGASATAGAGSSVHEVPGIAGGVVAHATKVPGVALAGSGCGEISGMLFAPKKNVHLDGGTQFVLGVAAAGSAR